MRGAIGRVITDKVVEDLTGLLFTNLGIPLIVDLVASLLLERRGGLFLFFGLLSYLRDLTLRESHAVLLVSDKVGTIVPIFEGLRTLLWPFQFRRDWQPLISDSKLVQFSFR